MKTFLERHAAKIRGPCRASTAWGSRARGRTSLTPGPLPPASRPTRVRLFDYPQWAAPLREEIRARAEQVAREAGLTIEFVQRKDFRKEARIKTILAARGDHPGLVHIFCGHGTLPLVPPLA